MNPSVSVSLEKTPTGKTSLEAASPLFWLRPIGDQDVDYQYLPELAPPPTSEVAIRFPALTEAQTELVHDFCRSGLLAKFRSLEASDDPYFRQLRHWRLAVYDHAGIVTRFHYELNGAEVESSSDENASVDWATEIPLFKLHSALTDGEALSSLYLRIEGAADFDVVEDPLVRCLFNGEFGAYQFAQLKRLKATESRIDKIDS